MTHLNKTRWLLPSVFSLLALLAGWYCKHETLPDNGNNPEGPNGPRSDCRAYVAYEAETTTYVRLVNQEQASLLQPEDHIMMMPHRERYSVEACYKVDGSTNIIINYLMPNDPIVYADNVADAWYKPDYSRVEMSNGSASYYDKEGNLMRTGTYEEDLVAIASIVESMGVRKVPSQAMRDTIFQRLVDNNLIEEHDAAMDVFTVRADNGDGTYSIQAINKSTLSIVGNFVYKADGTLQAQTLIDLDGTAESPVIKKIFMDRLSHAVSSEDIPMRITRYSAFDNFSFTSN
jgi:hypothetical protein